MLTALFALGATSARATSTFFGEDIPPGGAIPSSYPLASAAQSAFFATLGDPGTEDFSAFAPGATAPLGLLFRNPPGSGTVVETGTLTDPSSAATGFIATTAAATSGFPISPPTYWKNTTQLVEGLFRVSFDHSVAAFGFFATSYSTGSTLGGTGTQLELMLDLAGGGTSSFLIPHDVSDTIAGKVFYFGVITDPFVAATLLNVQSGAGDAIGFDDFTVAHAVVPEPSTGLLVATGLVALAAGRRQLQH